MPTFDSELYDFIQTMIGKHARIKDGQFEQLIGPITDACLICQDNSDGSTYIAVEIYCGEKSMIVIPMDLEIRRPIE